MKKAIISVLAFVLVVLFGAGAVQAEENSIEGMYTVVGSYGHEGFVPYDVAVYGGELVVCDKNNHRLSVIDLGTSKVTDTYGSYGEEGLRFPKGLEVYNRQLIVCDSFNNRIVFLNSEYKQTKVLELTKEPKDVCVLEDKLYVLMTDGAAVECYDLNTWKKEKSFSFKQTAERICGFNSLIIASGNNTVQTMDVESLSYEQKPELYGAEDLYAREERLYALYDGKVVEYGSDFAVKGEFITHRGNSIYVSDGRVYIGDESKALIYCYENGSISKTYGKERKEGEYRKISARGTLVAVMVENAVYIYKDGEIKATVDAANVVDIKLSGDRLFVLEANAIRAYLITEREDDSIELEKERELTANTAYSFTAMDERNGVIYICEAGSGKLLKVGTDLKVFSTAVSKLGTPISVAVNDERIFVAQSGFVGVYDLGGNRVGDIPGEYIDLSCNGVLYGLKEQANEIRRFDFNLKELEPIEYEGYFLGLCDIEAKKYGLYICDNVRKEVMVKTSEKLEISNDNMTLEGEAFDGTVIKGQTVKAQVSGAGMLNPLPKIGDIRFKPVSCGVDKGREFVREKGWYVADVSLPSVGNYTLKVKYQKQVYQRNGWQNVQSASGVVTVELPITVVDGKVASEKKREDFVKGIMDLFHKAFVR